jgi:glycosyltransferase involved in cell wall biosynthesis
MTAITIDVRMLNASGIGTYISNLVPGIISGCTDTKFYLLGNKPKLQELPWVHGSNVNLIDCRSPVYSVSEQWELFRKIPTDTALLWSPHYNIPLLTLRAVRRLVTIHDVFHLAFFDTLSFWQKAYARSVMNSAIKLSDRIVTVSDFSRLEIIKYTKTGHDKITVIYNGVDNARFKMTYVTDPTLVKEKLKLPDKFILFVGNVKPHKNLRRLLTAFEKILDRGLKDHHLVVAGEREGFITGDNGIFNLLKKSPALRENVSFTVHVENNALPAFYTAASLLVLPSLYEGFGLPPLEAMACGCPVMVSNAASLPEVCGDAAYYIDPYSVESIAVGIYNMLTDEALRQELIERGFERVKLFDWEESVKEHIKVIEKALA